MQPSVLLVRSDNVNGIGLRTILTQQDIRFVGDVTCLYRASQAAVVLRPDLILADALLANASLARFVAQLHDCSVHSKIVMLGNGLTGEEFATLEQRGLNGYIRWDDLNAVVLRHCLTAVVESGLQVNSPIRRERMDAAENHRHCGNSNIVLTFQERIILLGLASGMSQREVAREQELSLRTAERTVDALKDKLKASTTFTLAAQAVRLGLVS